jgi:hypothetical protein
VQFNKQGDAADENEVNQALSSIAQGAFTDLFVVSHGWNNDMADARNLYKRLFDCVSKVLGDGSVSNLGGRKFAVLGILWPSKKFAEEELIPSGAAGINSAVTVEFIQKQLDDLKGVFDKADADATLAKARQLVPQLENSKNAQREFADLIRSLPQRGAEHAEDASDRFFKLDGGDVMTRLSKPAFSPTSHTKPAGGAASLGSPGAHGSAGGAAGTRKLLQRDQISRAQSAQLYNLLPDERAGRHRRPGGSEPVNPQDSSPDQCAKAPSDRSQLRWASCRGGSLRA